MRKQGPVGFGIVGCGNIGRIHAEVIQQVERAQLVAVFDKVPAAAQALGEKYGVPWYADYDRFLAVPEIQVVNLCVPSGARGELCEAAARVRKNVLSEKPLEVTLERVARMIEACDAAGVRLGAILPVRFWRTSQLMYQAVSQGRLGRHVLGDVVVKWFRSQGYYDKGGWRGTWELDGGGALMNQSIHYIDLLQWLFGPVEQVCALTGTLAHERIEVEDTAVAILKFEDGALGVIEGGTSVTPGFPARVSLHGDKGTIVWQEQQFLVWKLDDATPEEEADMLAVGRDDARTGSRDPLAFNKEGHVVQIADMAEAVLENREPLIDGREGRKVVELILAMYQSVKTRHPVTLPLKGR